MSEIVTETKTKIELIEIENYKIQDIEQKQFYQIVLLDSGTVVGYYSKNEKYFLVWFNKKQIFETTLNFLEYKCLETPSFFTLGNYVGVYNSDDDFVTIFNEDKKNEEIKIPIINNLPKIKYPSFERKLSNYHLAGKSNNNVVPFLFRNMSLLPVFIADLKIDIAKLEAEWLNLKYWNIKNKINLDNETFEKPTKNFVLFDALNKDNVSYTYGIGNRDGGYLKYGMDFSDLITINETGKKNEILFSLGQLNKDSRKGGKECIFSSSAKYAILTPVYKSDDWKNKQKIFDLLNKELIDVKLPRGASQYRIIDHNSNYFLLVDNYINKIFAETENLKICMIK